MTRRHPDRSELGVAARMARADLRSFTRWPDRRGLIARPTLAECEASLSQPDDERAPLTNAPARDAA